MVNKVYYYFLKGNPDNPYMTSRYLGEPNETTELLGKKFEIEDYAVEDVPQVRVKYERIGEGITRRI